MDEYWRGIFSVLDALPRPQYFIKKRIYTEDDLAGAPAGTRIGDTIEVPNLTQQFIPWRAN